MRQETAAVWNSCCQAVEELFYQAEVTPELGIVANARQKQCLERAREQVKLALDALDAGELLDAVTVLLEEAADALLTLTGERVSDAVVNDVFSGSAWENKSGCFT